MGKEEISSALLSLSQLELPLKWAQGLTLGLHLNIWKQESSWFILLTWAKSFALQNPINMNGLKDIGSKSSAEPGHQNSGFTMFFEKK